VSGQATSYVCGTTDTPLRYQTIGNLLETSVDRYGDRECLIVRHQGVRLTYSEFAAAVESFAAGLLRLGLVPGDRIGIWSPNRFEWVVAQFASARAGLVLVNINPAYRVSELEYVLRKVGCKALVLAESFKSSDYIEMLKSLAPELGDTPAGPLDATQLPELRHVIHLGGEPRPGMMRFTDVAALADQFSRESLREIEARLQPDDPINVQFTSGTTGFPKGATLTHCNIVNNGFFVTERLNFTEEDRLCIPVPLYHCFGMVMGVLGCVSHGAAMVFPDEAFEPGSVLRAIEEERCTALYGVPTMFIAELNHPEFERFDLATLRTGVMAGSPCPIEVMKRVVNDMNMREVTIAYGMTETSPVSFQSLPDDPVAKRVSTVGRVHPYVEVKIVDQHGRVVPRGQSGEILTRGYSVMRGYWNDEEQTREAVDDAGWMHTGDLGVLDDDGYCNIVGRLKDLIIRGGENVYPREIEEYLYRHPGVHDVQVFGVPDPKFGEEICAWIIPKDGATLTIDEIRDFCHGRIAHYKMPRYVRSVREFPMTVTGKVQKFAMREAMIEELQLVQHRTA